MTSAYMRNLMGLRVSDDDMENIPHPYIELALHGGIRFAQVGAVLGSMVVAPLVTAIGGPRSLSDLADRAIRYGVTGARLGAVAGPLVATVGLRKEPEVAIYDRCYRLRYHQYQVRHDRFFLIGAGLGGASNGPPGALVGILSGIAIATAYNTLVAAKLDKAPRYNEVKARVQAAKQQQQ